MFLVGRDETGHRTIEQVMLVGRQVQCVEPVGNGLFLDCAGVDEPDIERLREGGPGIGEELIHQRLERRAVLLGDAECVAPSAIQYIVVGTTGMRSGMLCRCSSCHMLGCVQCT